MTWFKRCNHLAKQDMQSKPIEWTEKYFTNCKFRKTSSTGQIQSHNHLLTSWNYEKQNDPFKQNIFFNSKNEHHLTAERIIPHKSRFPLTSKSGQSGFQPPQKLLRSHQKRILHFRLFLAQPPSSERDLFLWNFWKWVKIYLRFFNGAWCGSSRTSR